MADEDRIRDKIRALLAKTKPGSGCTEEEAATAMNLASMMMMRHGIEADSLGDPEDKTGWGSKIEGHYGKWERFCADAAAYLYTCRLVYHGRSGDAQFSFVGRPDNVEACQMTFLWLVDQVEALYKQHLPKGLDQSVRAELRRTFKLACAARIRGRAWRLMESMAKDDSLALLSTGSTALVVKSRQEQLFGEADAVLKEAGTKVVKTRSSKSGIGTALGLAAGERVKLNEQVAAPKRLQIGVDQ